MRNGIALVTGANGFIGSHLCHKLLASGYHVRALVRATSNLQFIENLDLELAYGDISDPLSLPPVVSGVDLIFNPAGLVRARTREIFFEVNQIGTRNLVESTLKHNPGIKRFVHISSQAAAGPSDSLKSVIESDPPRPVSIYGESKLASEGEVMAAKSKIPITIIRPPAVYGPGDIDILKFFKIAKMGINPRLGIDQHYVSLVHVTDLVECIKTAAENDNAVGEIFFASNRDYYSIDKLIGIMSKCMKARTIDIAVPMVFAKCLAFIVEETSRLLNKRAPFDRDKLRELSQKYWICSPEKASRLLGWTASIPIEQGLEETYKWYKEKRWI